VFNSDARLFAWDNEPQDQISCNARYTTREESDQESRAEPELGDTEELSQTAAYTCDHAVSSRTPQCYSSGFHLGLHVLLPQVRKFLFPRGFHKSPK
jgi:hypothetical protein